MADIQALSHGLHPARLELLGLEAAAAGFCEEFSDRHGVTIDLHVENIPKALPREICLCFYRVVTLTVKDAGAGFHPHEAMTGRGLGLTSMQERLKVIGGQLSIDAQPERGTTIHAVAPLPLPTKSAEAV